MWEGGGKEDKREEEEEKREGEEEGGGGEGGGRGNKEMREGERLYVTQATINLPAQELSD